MSQLTIVRHQAPAYHPIQAVLGTLNRMRHGFAAWRAQRRAYAQLLSLGDRELKDMGIGRAQAAFESDQPFWRG